MSRTLFSVALLLFVPIAPAHTAAADGGSWSDHFYLNGVDENASALIVHDGALYAGGRFSSIGTVRAAAIARYDGSSSSSLGEGPNRGLSHWSRIGEGGPAMATKTVLVNRAPVLTLWAAVVAERLGYERDEALTLGKALAGLNAQSKGRRLAIFTPAAESGKKPAGRAPAATSVDLLGRAIPVKQTKEGVRALSGASAIDPQQVRSYLARAFGEQLRSVFEAMNDLAHSFPPEELETVGFGLYEKFRPAVAEGARGWGQKGTLDIARIRSMAGLG